MHCCGRDPVETHTNITRRCISRLSAHLTTCCHIQPGIGFQMRRNQGQILSNHISINVWCSICFFFTWLEIGWNTVRIWLENTVGKHSWNMIDRQQKHLISPAFNFTALLNSHSIVEVVEWRSLALRYILNLKGKQRWDRWWHSGQSPTWPSVHLWRWLTSWLTRWLTSCTFNQMERSDQCPL